MKSEHHAQLGRAFGTDHPPEKSPLLRTELRNVIWAEIAGGVISLDILVKKSPKAALRLEHMSVPISKVEKDSAADFVEDLMDAAYSGTSEPCRISISLKRHAGVPKRRRIKLFINPHSGPVITVSFVVLSTLIH